MSVVGWIAWAIVAAFIAGFDVALSHYKHTTLSDTWLRGSHNKLVRPLEAVAFLGLGAHLFAGTSVVIPIVGIVLAVGAGVVSSRSKRVQ